MGIIFTLPPIVVLLEEKKPKLLWVILVGGSVLLFVSAPIAFVIGAIKGIYRVSYSKKHWLCLGATLVVTTLVAWTTYPYMSDARIVWVIAFMTGIVSGVATEGMRRLVLQAFDSSEKLQSFAFDPSSTRALAAMRLFDEMNDRMIKKFCPI